jgi:hypothetical protein
MPAGTTPRFFYRFNFLTIRATDRADVLEGLLQ